MSTVKTATTPENVAKIEAFAAKIEQLFMNMYDRWLDEKDHEDIKEYGDRLARELPEGWKVEGMTKRPFGVKFSIGTDALYTIYLTSTAYGWKRIG